MEPTQTVPSLTQLDRTMLLELLKQACQGDPAELESIIDGIGLWSYIYLARWPAGQRPPVQSGDWQHATLPPISVGGHLVDGFTDDAFPLGPLMSGAVTSNGVFVGDVVPLPPETGDKGTINRLLLLRSAPAELFQADQASVVEGQDANQSPGNPLDDVEPAPKPPQEERASMSGVPSKRKATSRTPARPTDGPPTRPIAVVRTRRPVGPTTESITPAAAVALMREFAPVWGPTFQDDEEAVGAAQEVVLVTYCGPQPATMQVFGQALSRIVSAGRGGYPRAFTLPPAQGDRGTQRLLIIK